MVLNTLFSDEIPRYLMLCLRIEAFSSKFNDVLKHSMKIMSVYLDFCILEIKGGFFSEERPVFENLLKHYLKSTDLEKKIE